MKKTGLIVLLLILFSISVQAAIPGRTYYDTENNYFRYIVKQGDTFYNISRIFKISLEKLQGLNYNVNPQTMKIGDEIIISINENLDYYVVQPGDNIWEISLISDLSIDDIIAYNQLENPSNLLVSEVLFLPGIIAMNNNIKILGFEEKYGVVYISGVARIFEATVNYAFETREGEVLKEGFTTATIGAPEWGRFNIQDYKTEGAQTIAVFSISAKDGSRQDEIKLELQSY